ncbi:MAG: hypothetical protein QGI75_01140 [Phycisphaerales bacterium]|nr:hypothetical protein [Phycisphaerales bacterium]MDP6890976.1 hypothetical protein [Phycisphaerales bacterium]
MSESRDTFAKLSSPDADAVDHIAADGFDAERVPALEGDERTRGEALVDLFSLLDSYPVKPLSEDEEQTLIDATMARIRRAEDDRSDRMSLDNQPVMLGRGLRFRIAEALAVAAVLAMATAAIWSFGTTARSGADFARTHRNLSELHAGMSGFQDANDGDRPLTAASGPVARLFGGRDAQLLDMQRVADQGYCKSTFLRNPRRPSAGRHGFSYATLSRAQTPHLDHAKVILIGDRNPVLTGLLAGKTYEAAMRGSPIHARLITRPSVLFSDGHTEDLDDAACEGDCIWAIEPSPGPAPIEIFLAH